MNNQQVLIPGTLYRFRHNNAERLMPFDLIDDQGNYHFTEHDPQNGFEWDYVVTPQQIQAQQIRFAPDEEGYTTGEWYDSDGGRSKRHKKRRHSTKKRRKNNKSNHRAKKRKTYRK